MPEIDSNIQINENEIVFDFIHASGPGGQNVNKLSTAVKLRFDVGASPSLMNDVKERLIKLAGSRITHESVLIIVAKRYRTQEQNRLDAKRRLEILIRKASIRPKIRKPTKPSPASKTRRLETKKRRGLTKQRRTEINHQG